MTSQQQQQQLGSDFNSEMAEPDMNRGLDLESPSPDGDSSGEGTPGTGSTQDAVYVCGLPGEYFRNKLLQTKFELLVISIDPEATLFLLPGFRRIRVACSSLNAAREIRSRLHGTKLSGSTLRIYHANPPVCLSPCLVPPPAQRQYLISPPASPPVGWKQSPDPTPVINSDLICALVALSPGEAFELQPGTESTPRVLLHACDGNAETEGKKNMDKEWNGDVQTPLAHRPRIVQTRRPSHPQPHAVSPSNL
uniref:calcipressin-1-like n=1 Tax=Myxine glutinosa TaxID=7769 RepID=UPI00358FD041